MPEQRRPERLFIVRPDSIPGTEFLVAKDSFRGWRYFHERYAISACRTAAAGWQYRGKSFFLNDGSVALMEPGETHRNTSVHKYSDFKVLFIEQKTFEDAARQIGLTGVPHFQIAQSEDCRLFDAINRFCESAENNALVLEQQTMYSECVRLLLGYTESKISRLTMSNAKPAVQRVKKYLEAKFNEPVTLEELTKVSLLSPWHLVRAFSNHVGLPPHAFQIHLKIEKATTLLRAGISLIDVAADVGFSDQSHFTRHFKRIWGVTPGEYAKANK